MAHGCHVSGTGHTRFYSLTQHTLRSTNPGSALCWEEVIGGGIGCSLDLKEFTIQREKADTQASCYDYLPQRGLPL